MDNPTSGNVLIDGMDLSALNQKQAAIFRRRKVGLVYQFYNLIPTLTVRKNILMPLLLDKKSVNQEFFNQIVSSLGIEDKLESLPGTESVIRGTAAESRNRQILSLSSGAASGRRAYG